MAEAVLTSSRHMRWCSLIQVTVRQSEIYETANMIGGKPLEKDRKRLSH